MKRIKVAISLGCFFVGILLWGQLPQAELLRSVPVGDSTSSAPLAQVTESTTDRLRYVFTVSELTTATRTTKDGDYAMISIPGAAPGKEIGKPDLPVLRRTIQIPEGASFTVRHTVGNRQVMNLREDLGIENEVLPRQPPLPNVAGAAENAEFRRDAAAYGRKAFGPQSPVTLTELDARFAGRRLAFLEVSPVRYNPVKREIEVLTEITVTVEFEAAAVLLGATASMDAVNSDSRLSPREKRILKDIVGDAMLPEDDTKSVEREATLTEEEVTVTESGVKSWSPSGTGVGGRLLIITHDDFESGMDPFVTHKRNYGWAVDMFNTTQAGTSHDAIQDFIQARYANLDTRPDALLLVGDTDWIPVPVSSWHTMDLYYACMTADGTSGDWLPEFPYGRFPVRNLDQLDVLISKTIEYETMAQADWMTKATFVAGKDSRNGITSDGTHDYCITNYMDPQIYTFDTLYRRTDDTVSGPQISASFNAGRGLGVYSGHGGWDRWADGFTFTSSDVTALTNLHEYPLILNFSCATGTYDYNDSFAEQWVRGDSDPLSASDKGAVAMMAAGGLSYWEEDDMFQKLLFKAMFEEGYHTFGGAVLRGKFQLLDHMGSTSDEMEKYFRIYNCLGDPTLQLRFIPLRMDAPAITEGFLAEEYSLAFPAGGGAKPYTWSLTSGTLPDGVSLDTQSGLIQGIPTATGNYPVTLRVEDMTGETVSLAFDIDVFKRLNMVVDNDTIGEYGQTTATVSRQGTTSDLVVTLSSSDTSEAVVPASVTIPDGQSDVVFTIEGVEDFTVDGTQSVTITASAPGYQSPSGTVTVLDETNYLTVQVDQPVMSENGGSSGATVTRYGSTGELTVNLFSGDTTEATVSPGSVVIPDGQNSATFTISGVNDPEIDGTQTVSISAEAPLHLAGSRTVDIEDDDSPGTGGPIQNQAADAVTGTSARLNAKLFAGVGEGEYSVRVYWGTVDAGATNAWQSSVDMGTWTDAGFVNLSHDLTGLPNGQVTYYTFSATNGGEEIFSTPSEMFQTLEAPVASTDGGATGIGIGSATLGGALTSGVVADASLYWGAADGGAGTGAWDHVVSIGEVNTGDSFTHALSGLYYGVDYKYRIYVSNSAGADWSDVATFSTLEPREDWTPNEIATAAWYDAADQATITASDGLVSQLDDKSGGGNHAVASGDQQPSTGGAINGVHALTYDGYNNYMTLPTLGMTDGAYVVYVAKPVDEYIFTVTEADGQHDVYKGATYANIFRSSRLNSLSTGFPVNDAYMGAYEAEADASVYNIYNNGTRKIHDTGTFAFSDNWSTLNTTQSGESKMAGQIGEVIALDYVPTTETRQRIEGYLAWKWGLQGNLPSDHPYVSEAPTMDANISVTNTAASNITYSTADLTGTLNATQSVFKVHAYYSTHANATAEDWILDGDKRSVEIGTYTDVTEAPMAVTLTGLTSETNYTSTLMASNTQTNIWAESAMTFTTPAIPVTVNHAVPHPWLEDQNAAWADDYEAAALDDPDGDGFSTWREYWSGTDPRDSGSFLHIGGVEATSTTIRLVWEHAKVDGAIPDICIQGRSSLKEGTWTDLGASSPVDGTNTWEAPSQEFLFLRLCAPDVP